MKKNVLNEIEWYSRQTINSTFSQIAQELKKIKDYNKIPTIKDLADSAYTTPSSVTRFCNQIGYKGFKELTGRLSYELEFNSNISNKINIQEIQSTDYEYNKQFENIIKELNELSDESYQKIINVSNAILRFNKIYIISSNNYETIFYNSLINIGINAFYISDIVLLKKMISLNKAPFNSCFLIYSINTQYSWLESIISILKEAQLKYYIFCEYRDWFEENNFEDVLFLSSSRNEIVNNNTSVIICNYFMVQIVKMIKNKKL